jgi:hypothetical protein
MKTNYSTSVKTLKWAGFAIAILSVSILSGCKDDAPEKQDTPELITKATLTFTPVAGEPVVVTATDPDGEGVQDIKMDKAIDLQAGKPYSLSIALINELAKPSDPEYNITSEVEEESDEHMFFFGWTNDVFSDPTGNGNIDNRDDDVNYKDQDVNSLPLGLETHWTTATASAGTFRVLLKHQPALKTGTSGSSNGETDLDITFEINIQ